MDAASPRDRAAEQAAGGTTAAPKSLPDSRGTRSGLSRRLSLRDRRVRTRLLVVILIPLLIAVIAGALQIATVWQQRQNYYQVEQLTRLDATIINLAHVLEEERDRTALYAVQGRPSDTASLNSAQGQVDKQIVEVQKVAKETEASFEGDVRDRVAQALYRLDTLESLRKTAMQSQATPRDIVGFYTPHIQDLINTSEALNGLGERAGLSTKARALAAFSRHKELTSRMRALTVALIPSLSSSSETTPDQALVNELTLTDALRNGALEDFRAAADSGQYQHYQDTVLNSTTDRAENLFSLAQDLAKRTLAGSAAGDSETDNTISTPAGAVLEMTRAELSAMQAVERKLLEDLFGSAKGQRKSAEWYALATLLIALFFLAVTVFATLSVAQSMSRPLMRLRRSAQDIAKQRLPALVHRLNESDPSKVDLSVRPIGIDTKDEIGEVARAFDEIHREAVRLAGDQALLRSSVNAMFVNLSRRTQSLVQRQLKLIDELERGERDPDQLASLFKLDHLATRMRRNGENLLVLAGEEPGRRWNQPIPLIDVLRAAASEVEQYERITISNVPTAEANGRAVNDLVHLLAELLENATSYSSPGTKVWVAAQALPDGGIMVEIEDGGIGMNATELAEANERLAKPPAIDVSVSRRMGLFVVARLAERHGLRVRLRASAGGGVTALVLVPDELVMDHNRPAPTQPAETPQLPTEQRPAPPAPIPSTDRSELPRRPVGGEDRPQPPQPSRPQSPLPQRTPNAQAPGPQSPGPLAAPLPPRRPQPSRAEAPPPMVRADQTGEMPVTRAHLTGELPVYRDHTGEIPAVGQRPSANTGSQPPLSPRTSRTTPQTPQSAQPRRQPSLPTEQPPSQPPVDARASLPTRPEPVRDQLENSILDTSTPLEVQHNERSPIFEQMESEWFRRRSGRKPSVPVGAMPGPEAAGAGSAAPAEPSRAEPVRPATAASPPLPTRGGSGLPTRGGSGLPTRKPGQQSAGSPPVPVGDDSALSWKSAGDDGWKAAETINKPVASGLTPAGLPKRVPKANLVPGSADAAEAANSGDSTKKARSNPAARSPEAVRGRLSSYHQGLRKGRMAGRELRQSDGDTLTNLPAVSSDEQEKS